MTWPFRTTGSLLALTFAFFFHAVHYDLPLLMSVWIDRGVRYHVLLFFWFFFGYTLGGSGYGEVAICFMALFELRLVMFGLGLVPPALVEGRLV